MNKNNNVTLTDGSPVTPDHKELLPNGQQKGYVVLSQEERSKGFIRPLRKNYIHVGKRPIYPLRDLTEEEHIRCDKFGYVKFEKYPEDNVMYGMFWTKEQLNGGCKTVTTMSDSIAKTYARDPKFYGATFCCHCNKHLPLDEFVWEDGTAVGS